MIRSLYEKLLNKSKQSKNEITDDLSIILDGDKTYAQLTIGEKHNPTQRKKDNEAALSLIARLKDENREPTDQEKETLSKYTGDGGLGGQGSEDEYYTPAYIASGAWELMGDIDESGKYLDPSAGMGIFSRTKPSGASITQIELSNKSAEINAALTGETMLQGSFEKRSYDIENDSMDGIITNVPFASIGSEGLADKSPRFNGIQRIEHYFILRSLELLKPGKRATFIVPTGILDNKATKLHDYKKKILQMASFIGGVRLPNKIFSHTGADVAVDILVFEKHRSDAYKALRAGIVQYESREQVIFENEVNRSFIFGYYFDKPIGKKNMIGTKISSKEFSESRFLGETKYPKTAVLTEDDMETLKAKTIKIFKQAKFSNTTEYDKLILMNDTSILDKLSLEALSEMDESIAFFKMINNKIFDGEEITIDNLEEYKKRYVQFSGAAQEGKVVNTFTAVPYYLPLMAINFTETIGESTKKMLDALIFGFISPSKITTSEQEKAYSDRHETLKIIADKSYASKFKDKLESKDKERVNHQIAKILGKMSIKLLSNWDMDNNMKPKQMAFNRFQSLHDVLALKGRRNELTDNGDYDSDQFTKDEILGIDDLFLSQNGGIIPMSQIAYDGAKFSTAIDYVTSLSYEDGMYGLTSDEFDEKIAKMVNTLNGRKKTVDFNSLQLDHRAIMAMIHKSDKGVIRGIEDDIVNSLDLLYIKADNITDPEKEDIEFPSTVGIAQFYAKDYVENFDKLWDLYEEDIKAVLGTSDYDRSFAVVQLARSKVFEGGEKQYEKGRTVFEKLKPVILKDIRKKRQQFDILLETQIRMNPVITAKIKEKLERDSTIRAGGEADHERVDFLGEYINASILDTNHGYQNEDIRHFSTSMKGIIAQDTGLGKSRTIFLSALASVVTNRAKRALVVVPTSVFDKWVMEIRDGRRDAAGNVVMDSMLNDSGKEIASFTTSTSAQKDWSDFCKDSTKRIMVMPHSVFDTFSFRSETHEFVVGTTKQDERGGEIHTPGAIPDFNGRDYDYMVKAPARSVGYFEDGHIEMLIIDEGQMAKNSSTGGKSFKFASGVLSSRYGVCVRVVQALISRKHGRTGQGVIIATATPFTSSPYEIFTMLKNTGGMDMLDSMKEFADTFMDTEKRDEVMATDPDKTTQVEVFEGLKNIQLLNSMGLSQIYYRNAKEESEREVNSGLEKGALKPDYDEIGVRVEETDEIQTARAKLLARYDLFKEARKQYYAGQIDENIAEKIATDYGYDLENQQHRTEAFRKGTVFSLVNSLNLLSLNRKIATDGIIEFNVSDMKQGDLEKLKTKLLNQDVTYPDIEIKVDKDGNETEKIINVKTKLSDYLKMNKMELEKDGKLQIPEVSEKIIKIILDANDKNDTLLDIEDYPKYKLLLENITKEISENSKAKQLIFSISIAGARIIEHFIKHLYRNLSIDHKLMNAVDVAKVNKQSKDEEDEDDQGALAQFQEDYNNSEISTVLIFTKKNSTGVDFNRMTKAIHLVEIPYTPDVWHQAMGRGVRQGNKIDKVNVYQYSTDGTIDMMKLRILSEKGDWQEALKESEGINHITSIQTDGEKVIQQALAKNINAGVAEIEQILNEQKSQREAIIKEEQSQRVEAIKAGVTGAYKLKSLLLSGDTSKIIKNIAAVDEVTSQKNSIDITHEKSTGKNIVKNIKANSYNAIHHFITNELITEEFLKDAASAINQQQFTEDALDRLEVTKEATSGYAYEYLNKTLSSVYLDRDKEYYIADMGYRRDIVSTQEEIDAAKEDRYYRGMTKLQKLTDAQYEEAKNIIENNIKRAKADVEARVLRMLKADEIMRETAKQASKLVPDDEKELFEGIASGKSVFADDGSKVSVYKVEDTVNMYSHGYNFFIEIPDGLVETSYTLKLHEKTDEFRFEKHITKTHYKYDYVTRYYKKIEENKEKIEQYKDKIEKYFNTNTDKPVLSYKTLKPLKSIKDFVAMIQLVDALKDYSDMKTMPDLADFEPYIKGEDEIMIINGDTFALINNRVIATRSYFFTRPEYDISEGVAKDGMYSASSFSHLVEGQEYNYKLLVAISGAKEDDIKQYVSENNDKFRHADGALFPRYSFMVGFDRFIQAKETEEVLSEGIKNTGTETIKDKDIDTLKAYFKTADTDQKAAFYEDVVNGNITELAALGRTIKEIKSADSNKITVKQKYQRLATKVLITDNFDILIEDTSMNPDIKPEAGWYEAGVSFNKRSVGFGYNEYGNKAHVSIGWKISNNSTIML